MTIEQISFAISIIRQFENLNEYKKHIQFVFKKFFKITGPQVNFLITIVACERIKEKGIVL